MSEFWVSKKKYYCTYCEIYIADDAPSRAQHENGLRHKGNKDRFIRGLYKTGVKKKQESEEEKRELKRVEEAAQAAYARDIGAGLVTPSASSSVVPVPAAKPKPPPPKPSDPYANYTTAASLGFTDPDVDRLFTEMEIKKSEGRAGDWVAVVPPPPPLPQTREIDPGFVVKTERDANVGDVRKRAEEPVDEDDTRQFKMRKKSVAVGLGEIYDPGIIRVRPRTDPDLRGESKSISLSNCMPSPGPVLGAEAPQCDVKSQNVDLGPTATAKPAWIRREWTRAGEDNGDGANSARSQTAGACADEDVVSPETTSTTVKTEVSDERPDPEAASDTPKEDPTDSELLSGISPGGGLFRKRKGRRRTSTREHRQM